MTEVTVSEVIVIPDGYYIDSDDDVMPCLCFDCYELKIRARLDMRLCVCEEEPLR